MSQTILIIDDLASVRLYHANLLSRKGYRCLAAASGQAALELLGRERADLVMLDLVMPGMGGAEFIRHLDANPALASIPVLVITAEEAQARGLSGAFRRISVVSKPVMPAALLRQIGQLLPPVATPVA